MSIIGKLDAEVKVNNVPKTLGDLEETVRIALDAVGVQAEGNVAMLAPVDTGRLRGSITHELATNGERAVFVGTNVEYAVYQELGTSRMKAANGGKGYLRPGIENYMKQYVDIIRKYLSEERGL